MCKDFERGWGVESLCFGFSGCGPKCKLIVQGEFFDMSQRFIITNCRLLDEQESEKTVSVLIEDGIILQTGQTDICDNLFTWPCP